MSKMIELPRRQDAHSRYLMFAALFSASTLVIDLTFHAHMENRWFLWTLLVICIIGAAVAALFGDLIPRVVWMGAVFAFVGAQLYFLSRADDPASVVASVQQLPLVSFYLGWFVRPRVGFPLIATFGIAISVVMAFNPLFGAGGVIGAPVAVHGILGMLACFGIGSYLRHRDVRNASLDALTGAFNRRGFQDRVQRALTPCAIRNDRISLVAIDFDGFKQLNDTNGHAFGDAVLVQAVTEWQESLQGAGVIGRLGGDEFAILFIEAGSADAGRMMAKLRANVRHPWTWGLAAPKDGDSAEVFIARADSALYTQKRRGAARRSAVPDALATWPASVAHGPNDPDHSKLAPTVRARETGRPRRRTQWARFMRWQSTFAVVSSAVALLLAIVFFADIMFGHDEINRPLVMTWLTLCLAAACVPLVYGRSFPRWAGLLLVVGIEVLFNYMLTQSLHAHAQLNALLELPTIALYLGWFYTALIARLVFVLTIIRVILASMMNPTIGDGIGSAEILVAYAIVIAVFCFEGARGVRRSALISAITDPLTGVLNRRGLADLSEKLVRRAGRDGSPLTLVVVDFDNFKLLNDQDGHHAGDQALKQAAASWRALVGMRGFRARTGGIVARLGGDEFALVFRSTPGQAEELMKRNIEGSEYSWSWGIRAFEEGETLEDSIVRADADLYRAKRRAREGEETVRLRW